MSTKDMKITSDEVRAEILHTLDIQAKINQMSYDLLMLERELKNIRFNLYTLGVTDVI